MKWLVPEREKLISFLQRQIDPPPSGKLLRRVLEARLCRVNGAVERYGSTEVGKGSIVELAPSWNSLLSVQIAPTFKTIEEDEHLLIVDKPTGWICTDDECKKSFGPSRYLVHRLDKETTGVLLIAKSVEAREAMIRLFRDRAIEKLYFALVDQIPAEDKGVRKSLFAKIGPALWGSRPKGLSAETHWKIAARGKGASLIACQPITGRTHQIRVHLSEMGHPILADRQYAEKTKCKIFVSRPLLHASRIRFKHPLLNKDVDASAPLPEDFCQALEDLDIPWKS